MSDDQEFEVQEETGVIPGADQQTETPAEPEAPSIEERAREMGWRPKEEWEGPEDKWREADEYVKRGEEFLPIVQARARALEDKIKKQEEAYAARLQKIEEFNQRAMERQRAEFEAEKKRLQEEERQAVREADEDAYEAIQRRKQELERQVSPEAAQPQGDQKAIEWAQRNPWFTQDRELHDIAVAAAGRVASRGGDTDAQIRAAETAVRAIAPDVLPPAEEAPARPAPRQVAPDTPSAAARLVGAKRSPSADLTKEERETGQRFVKEGLFKNLDEYARAMNE
jgi:hypothetical protein